MCGICGILDSTRSAAGMAQIVPIVSRMTHALRLRGPDAEGLFNEAPIALGHRRLSILELSDAGAQPMQTEPRGPVISFNGEIYNFEDLRAELLRESDTPWRGRSDTEVILRAYRAWGLDGLKRLEGIFALAIWDHSHDRLVLMRDRLGVKPLFYAECPLGLAFASEIHALRLVAGVDLTMDDQAFREYLWYGAAMEDRTFYCGVRQIEPGSWLIAQRGKITIEPWFRLEEWITSTDVGASFESAAAALSTTLDRAVARQLVADVPVSIFLSGGVDSSSIAAAAARCGVLPQAVTVSFARSGGPDESPKAQIVADHLKLPLQRLNVDQVSLWEVIEQLAHVHGEPFSDAANVPLYLMARALHGRFKVVLQGDGGDELFAGYRRYALLRQAHWWRLMPPSLNPVLRTLGSFGQRLSRLAESVGSADPAMRMARLLTLDWTDDPPETLLEPDRRAELSATTDPFSAYRRAATRFAQFDPVQQMLLTDLTVLLPSVYLPKVDRATMAAGVEARVPLLDEGVLRVALSTPTQWKVKGLQKKALLRAAMRGRVPDAILDGPKTGFGVPFSRWLSTDLKQGTYERVLDPGFRRRFGWRESEIRRLVQPHGHLNPRHALRLWKLLQLAIWNGAGQ
jgi:asparagine synthase (glutamine-hydrolysing)